METINYWTPGTIEMTLGMIEMKIEIETTLGTMEMTE